MDEIVEEAVAEETGVGPLLRTSLATLRGFNYNGSWGTSGLDLWQHFDFGKMATEISRGKRYFPSWNAVRWQLSQESYQRDPARFIANFHAGLSIFAAHEIAVMPILFNRWRDPLCDFGGVSLEHIVPGLSHWSLDADLFVDVSLTSRKIAPIQRLHREYLEDVVGGCRDDARIFAWDLCNEPFLGEYIEAPDSEILAAEGRWLLWCYKTSKALGAVQPLTVGNWPSLRALRLTEPYSDFLSIHPYYMWSNVLGTQPELGEKAGFERFLDEILAFSLSVDKGVVASETVWGSPDDETHAEGMMYTLGELTRRNIGFFAHALNFSLVADLHPVSYGPVGPAECLHFINADGSLRKGHEAFNDV